MSGFSVFQDSYIGATIVSNRFIDEYMTEANDAQLKVYLYLVRMLNAHLETSVTDIADRFNHTEKEVIRAFKYWEKRGVLTIDYDPEGNLTGVHLMNLCRGELTGPTVEETHNKVKVPEEREIIKAAAAENASSVDVSAGVEPVKAENAKVIPIKSSYSASEIAKFSAAGGKQLTFLAEAYFGKPVTQSDLQTLCYMSDCLEMSDDLIDYLLQYCVEKGKKDFRYAEKVAIGWKEKGISTVDQAKTGNRKYDKNVYDIMNRLGKSGSPTDKEMDYIIRWRDVYGFSDSVIFEACDRTVMATDSHRFQYAEGILSNWSAQGIRELSDIENKDKEHKSSSLKNGGSTDGSTGGARNGNGKKNSAGSFGNYRQNEIDYDEVAKKLFAN